MAPTAAVVVVVVAMMMVVVVTACRIRKKKDMAEDVSDVVELAFSRNLPSVCYPLTQTTQRKDPYEYEFAYQISRQKNCSRYD